VLVLSGSLIAGVKDPMSKAMALFWHIISLQRRHCLLQELMNQTQDTKHRVKKAESEEHTVLGSMVVRKPSSGGALP